MLEFALSLFETAGFQTRNQGVSWTSELIWLHVGGDLFIWLACVSISFVMFYLVRRREVPYPRLFILFALFLLASGFGHLIEALMFHYPVNRIAGVVKVLSAVLAWAAALTLIPIIPRVMAATPATTLGRELGDTTLHRLAAMASLNRVKDYIIAILAAVLALLVRAAIEPLVESDHFYVLSLLAVVFVAWQCGFGPSILTLFVSMLGMIYFFLGERRSFVVTALSDQLATAVFFFCGVCCAGLGEAQRIARRRAKAALEIALERKAELEAEVARRKEIEGALRQNEHYLRSVLDNTPDCIKVLSLDGRLMEMNRPGQCVMEIDDFNAVRGTAWATLWDGAGKAEASESVVQAVAGKTSRFQAGCRTAKGTFKHWDVQVAPIPGADGRAVQLVSVSRDITEQQRAAEAVRESEERWRLVLDAAELGAWSIDPDTNTLTADDRFQIIFAGAVGPISYEEAFGLIHPDDRDRIRSAVAEAIRPANPVPYAAEYRVVRNDGTMRWVFGKGRANFTGVGSNRRIVSFNGTVADITDRKWAEDALRESEERFRSLADAAPAMIWVSDLDKRRIYFNRTWLEFTGRTMEQDLGDGWTDHIHPLDRDRYLEAYNAAFTARQSFEIEYRLQRHDGVYRWVLARGTPRFTPSGSFAGFLGLCLDVTDRMTAQENLLQSEQRFRTVTEAIPQIVWNSDAGGEVTYFNRRWLEYTDLPVEKAKGDGWMNAIHPDDRARVFADWRNTIENGKAGKPDRFTHELRLKNGTTDNYRWFLSVAVPLRRADGTIDQWIGSMADIHDQKTVAETLERMVRDRTADLMDEIEERRRAEQQVRAVAAELERSNGELEQFAYIASHDLQEPLRKIQAFGDRLRTKYRDELPDPGKEYVDRMYDSSSRMRRLIDDLLNYSRVTTSARPFSRVELNRLLPEVVGDLEERIEQTGGTVDVGDLPALEADPTQMRQLFQNLIGNAVKFHRPGVPPVVEVRGELVMALLPGNDRELVSACRITVRDNGIGFDEKYLSRIFQVFQRLHGRNEYEGTGVGLAICRKITERHGGTITAQSRIGEGATFVVTLPVRQPREDATADVQPVKEASDDFDGG